MTQEALKNLLDAVEAAIQAGDWKVDGACDPDLVIRRAKQALAQPEQEPVISKWVLREVYFDEDGEPISHRSTPQPERHELQAKGEHPAPCARHCEANAFQIVIKNLKAQLAKPEQEPFGYFRYDLRLDAWVQNRAGITGTPFYTTPPQRKPLTDVQIGQILDDPNIAEAHQGNWRVLPFAFARAIEAAHGIKENT